VSKRPWEEVTKEQEEAHTTKRARAALSAKGGGIWDPRGSTGYYVKQALEAEEEDHNCDS